MPETSAPTTGRDFLVPDLGEGLEDATVIEWFVAVGDTVELNQPLCALETAKAAVDIPSPFAGRVLERRGAAGDTLKVGAVLIRIDTGGNGSPQPPRRTPTLVAGVPPNARPPVRKLARDLGVVLADIATGSGVGGTITRDDVRAAAEAARAQAPRTEATRTEAARRPAAHAGQADRPSRTGQAGRVAAPVPVTGTTGETVPVLGERAAAARRVTSSRSRIADATCAVTVDCGRLLEVSDRLNTAAQRAGGPGGLTPFVLLARLVVDALAVHPDLNASFVDDGPAIRRHHRVHLGVTTATDHGQQVVVVRDAGALSLLDLAAEISRLTASARAGTATEAELTGSTITVSDLGPFGLDKGTPVINYPEAAILALGSVRQRPMVLDGRVVTRPTAVLTLAFDHRVADGAEGGRFMTELTALVEDPDLALLRA